MNTRLVFDEVGRAFGLGVVFDGDYPESGSPLAFRMDQADYREALRAVRSLEFGKPGNLLFASGTPSGPEIKQNDLATVGPELCSSTRSVFQREIGGWLPLIRGQQTGADGGSIGGGADDGQREKQG